MLAVMLTGALAMWLFAPSSGMAQERIMVWSYYVYPPFDMGDGHGAGTDFVTLMNKAAQGRFAFIYELMPRKRIDLKIDRGEPGIVLFVSPKWMEIPSKSDAVWSKPLFHDQNGVLFSGRKQIDYEGPESLYGMVFGGVVGRRYKDLEPAFKSGRIVRQDSWSEESNVRKLAIHRIDVTTAPQSVLRYLVNSLGVADKVRFSSTPLYRYSRRLLINNLGPDVRQFLSDFVDGLPDNPDWQAIVKKYSLHTE